MPGGSEPVWIRSFFVASGSLMLSKGKIMSEFVRVVPWRWITVTVTVTAMGARL